MKKIIFAQVLTTNGTTEFSGLYDENGNPVSVETECDWFCQYHLTHFIRTRIMQRERYDHSRAFFGLPEAAHHWRCRFFC